jgi:mycothiol synthase
MLSIKPFTQNDYQTMTDIENSVFTDDPYSAESNRQDDTNRPAHINHQRWVAWFEGQGVAYGHYTQDINIPTFDASPYAHLRSELEQQGIEILNLEQILTQEGAAQKYYQLHTEVENDVPRAYPVTERGFEDFAKWNLDNPKVLPKGTFIAVQNNQMIGVSQLSKTDGGHLNIGLTGVRREARGKHIALALKVACLEWAKANQYPEIRTWNDSNNTPILALNTKLGFVQCPAWIECIKELQGENP